MSRILVKVLVGNRIYHPGAMISVNHMRSVNGSVQPNNCLPSVEGDDKKVFTFDPGRGLLP
jgi:hypothetical protein